MGWPLVNIPVARGRLARDERLHLAPDLPGAGTTRRLRRWRHEALETEPEPHRSALRGWSEAAVLVELQHAPGMALAGDQGPNRAEQLVMTRMPSEADELTWDLLATT